MIWARIIGVLMLAASGAAVGLLAFNFAVIVTHANLGFCRNAAELLKPDRYCPEPLWFWLGNALIVLVMFVGAVRKILRILKKAAQ